MNNGLLVPEPVRCALVGRGVENGAELADEAEFEPDDRDIDRAGDSGSPSLSSTSIGAA